jgi:hypothetical protein
VSTSAMIFLLLAPDSNQPHSNATKIMSHLLKALNIKNSDGYNLKVVVHQSTKGPRWLFLIVQNHVGSRSFLRAPSNPVLWISLVHILGRFSRLVESLIQECCPALIFSLCKSLNAFLQSSSRCELYFDCGWSCRQCFVRSSIAAKEAPHSLHV